VKTNSALSWFGSDSQHREHIARYFDHCDSVTVGMVGGASIIPCMKAPRLVCNDKCDLAYNFYRCVSDPVHFAYLVNRCRDTLNHPAELRQAMVILRNQSAYRREELAWAFWAACWLGRKGAGGTENMGGTVSVRWTPGGANASRIITVADGLYAWRDHFKRCDFTNLCFRQLLPKVPDRLGCGLYLDPPWVEAGLSYLHTFDEKDHRDLADLVQTYVETTVLLRYRDHPLLRELYPFDMWTWVSLESRTQANTQGGEVWIINKGVADLPEHPFKELVA